MTTRNSSDRFVKLHDFLDKLCKGLQVQSEALSFPKPQTLSP